ncbi:hypothetical protein GALL_226960 [mine drainage metagenome]|uniref:Uncharacterized protein n=1 Tax=mine drainage metagenome TaxID=410659 RepID=A0A1J5RHR5_9ZZZZ
MFTLTVSLDSLSLYIVAADVLILLSYVLFLLHQKRTLEKSIQKITDFVSVYFLNTGVEVQVTCYRIPQSTHFVALIESAPLKRFRFSNVLESNLITHILSTTGNVVEKIYWRFPVQFQKEALLAEEKNAIDSNDEYFSEVHAITKAEYSVSEVPWAEYEGSKLDKVTT